ncbi:MAG: ATP-binding protein [Eubacteriales bacterium]|nr:ATP-binding protein [Eubacteriales bacterium]
MFIGRQEELQFLEHHYAAAGGQLVVLYGRRRIGKTELLRKFCEGKEHIFYSCTEIPDAQQLASFSERLLSAGLPAARYIRQFSDWESALRSLPELPFSGKKLIVIDEFPYMVKSAPSLPSLLQKLWDESLRHQNILLILCGSSMSFMEKEILSEKNPLYGRASGILKMNEMDFYDAAQFFPRYTPIEKITAYAVLGGTPHYLRQFDDTLSIGENIIRSILTRGSILYSEVEFLLRQELRETAVYNAIIEAVALGNTRLNDLYAKTQIEKNKLSVYLKNMIALGILQREFPVTAGVKERAASQRGLYQVVDPFFRFWYAFVFPYLSELEAGDSLGIWQHAIEPELDSFVSRPFEEICRQFLRRLNKQDALPFHFTRIGRWWNKTDELDIMASDAHSHQFLLGECKYKNSAFSLSDWEKTQHKFSQRNAALYYFLFSRSGFTESLAAEAARQNISLKTADDIVNGACSQAPAPSISVSL